MFLTLLGISHIIASTLRNKDLRDEANDDMIDMENCNGHTFTTTSDDHDNDLELAGDIYGKLSA